MGDLAKYFIIIGVVFIVAGCAVFLMSKIPGVGKLPGDIMIKRENFTFYFPVVTCILISLFLSTVFFLINK